MRIKKKKKEPSGVVSNLNMLIDNEFCAYKKSRLKNVLDKLKTQLEPDEHEKLKELYVEIEAGNADICADDSLYEDFAAYVKKLIRKYAKKSKS